MKIETLILIPARSGSKGIPDKNIKLLGGKPLIAWTAEILSKANLKASLAILSTDSEKYAKLGRDLGLLTPFIRPAEYAADDSSAVSVVLNALQWFETEYGYIPEQLLWLQPTSPFRSAEMILKAFTLLTKQQADAVVACKEIHRNLSTLFYQENGHLSALSKNTPIQTTRQQIKPLLTPNGALYLCNTAAFLKNKSFYPDQTIPLIMNTVMSLDIDSEEDWLLAEAYIKQGLVK
ncbi:acylneuraminate cytidylyltransferase family protein [Methylomonas sp. AM2-LC]|uniref:acylneuraminate cytidylyltransferase family protein n=1 Tax=Methylomonas sp. AM2-LC TaxID=3153301 RepID=UPI003264CA46